MANKKRTGRPSKYPPGFQRDAAAMVLDEHRSMADVARSIGVIEATLGTGSPSPAKNVSRAQPPDHPNHHDDRTYHHPTDHHHNHLRFARHQESRKGFGPRVGANAANRCRAVGIRCTD